MFKKQTEPFVTIMYIMAALVFLNFFNLRNEILLAGMILILELFRLFPFFPWTVSISYFSEVIEFKFFVTKHTRLFFAYFNFPGPKRGYLYTSLSNETPPVAKFFDDLQAITV